MKTLKQISATISLSLAALALAAFATGCTDDNELTDTANNGNGESGKQMTITVGTGTDASTRVAYEEDTDGTPKQLTWQADDKLTVVGFAYNGFFKENKDYILSPTDAGKTSGSFTGDKISEATTYNVYYPKANTIINPLNGTATLKLSDEPQTQVGNGSTAHLRNNILLSATDVTDLSNITLTMQSSIMKFVLKNVPTGVATLKRMVWKVETASGTKYVPLNFSTEDGKKVDFSSGSPTLTAYMAFLPEEMAVKAGGKFIVTLIGDKAYRVEIPITAGKTYEAGKRYTAEIGGASGAMTWTEVTAVMKFKVDTSKSTTYPNSFTIPFYATDKNVTMNTPADITVDWGDETEPTTVTAGTSIVKGVTFKHKYTTAGTYTITISSSQLDETQKQIPFFGFYLDSSKHEENYLKLISIDTSFLNMEETLLDNSFQNCSNLTTIPAELFDKNTQVTRFSSCFFNCSSLETIPAELFDNNTQVTSFNSCFKGCSSLKEIPARLFNNNIEAKDFSSCFILCSSLTVIPTGLFNNNTKATSFYKCFMSCIKLETIPNGLFAKNTQATDFSHCFSSCTMLKLNNNTFIDANNTKDTRFKNLTSQVYFTQCFFNAGKNRTSDYGTAPNLWEYKYGAEVISSMCFTGINSSVTIPGGSIPSGW